MAAVRERCFCPVDSSQSVFDQKRALLRLAIALLPGEARIVDGQVVIAWLDVTPDACRRGCSDR